jgi:hypothetical protein
MLAGIVSCDPVYPPFIKNNLSSQIGIRVDYTDGTYSEGVLNPRERLVFGPKGKDVNHLLITSNQQRLYDLDSQALAALRGSVSDERSVTWSIESDGIKPMKKE